jgi:hypothetical protein
MFIMGRFRNEELWRRKKIRTKPAHRRPGTSTSAESLLLGLRAIPLTPDLKISVEKFDDVAFDNNGTPSELIQTKHHIGSTGNLSNASSDLWNTLLIWVKATKAPKTGC